MTDQNWLDSLPTLDVASLPTVFDSEADRARTDGKLTPGIRRYKHSADGQQFRNSRKQSAAAAILDALPASGETLHVCLDGSFDLCHLIPRIIDLSDETCEALDIQTLGFNDQAVTILAQLTDAGRLKRLRLLASDYFRSVDTELWGRAHAELTRRGHALYVCRTHAKTQCYRFASGRTITLLSSANLRSCKNAEFALLFADPGVFTFWRGIIEELIEEAGKCAEQSRSRLAS